MAVIAPMLSRQVIFGAGLEVTTGTAVALDATHAAFNFYNHTIRATIPRNRRPGQGVSLGQLPQVPGARMGEITGETDVVGNGSAGVPSWGLLLQAAGLGVSAQTYLPQSGNASYATLTTGIWQDGRFKSIVGASADWVIRGSAGNPCRSFWRLQGVWQAPTLTALVAPTYPTTIPPRLASATFTIGGSAYRLADFELSLNNVLTLRPDSGPAGGYLAAAIPDHDYSFKCNLEAATAKDWSADHLAGTEAALNLVIGATANNIITITAPKMQLADPPEDVDAGGIIQDALMFQLNKSAAAGEDFLSIVFS